MSRMKKQDIFPGMKYTQLSVRVWEAWLEIIRNAAEKARVSVPEYTRSRLLPVACDDLGIEEPEFPPLDKRGAPTAQSYAAAKFGMPVEEWRRKMLTEVASQAIRVFESGAPPPPSVKQRKRTS